MQRMQEFESDKIIIQRITKNKDTVGYYKINQTLKIANTWK